MGSIRKRGRGYEARYRDPSGHSRSKSFRTKAEARNWLTSNQADIDRGNWIDPQRSRTKFGEFSRDWYETTRNLKPSTRAGYETMLRVHVLPYFKDAPLGRIERMHVQKWMVKLQEEGLGSGTIRNAFRVLSRILVEAERSRYIPRNPAAGISPPKARREEMHFLTAEEVIRLAEAMKDSKDPNRVQRRRYRALILTAGFCGLRWSECVGLRVSRLDLLRGVVEVRETLTEIGGRMHWGPTKTGASRTIALPKFLVQVLAEHIAAYPNKQGLVFSSLEGEPLRKHFLRRHFHPALEEAGLAKVRFHDLRHSAASIAIGLGGNVKQVQEMLGHSSATVTLDIYAHLFPSLTEQLREGLDAAYREAETKRTVGNLWDSGVGGTVVRMPEKDE
jgi:integrase